MILDKLLEKKDVLAYIDFRTEELHLECKRVSKEAPEKTRHTVHKLLESRIAELRRLRAIIKDGSLKKVSIKTSLNVYKKRGVRE